MAKKETPKFSKNEVSTSNNEGDAEVEEETVPKRAPLLNLKKEISNTEGISLFQTFQIEKPRILSGIYKRKIRNPRPILVK